MYHGSGHLHAHLSSSTPDGKHSRGPFLFQPQHVHGALVGLPVVLGLPSSSPSTWVAVLAMHSVQSSSGPNTFSCSSALDHWPSSPDSTTVLLPGRTLTSLSPSARVSDALIWEFWGHPALFLQPRPASSSQAVLLCTSVDRLPQPNRGNSPRKAGSVSHWFQLPGHPHNCCCGNESGSSAFPSSVQPALSFQKPPVATS